MTCAFRQQTGTPNKMKNQKQLLDGGLFQQTFFSVALFFCAMIFVFWDVLPKFYALVAPDDPFCFYYAFRTDFFESLMCGKTLITPASLYGLVFPPLYSREFSYIFGTFFFAVAITYYLRARGLSVLAAWTGGLVAALSGYTFTIFAAGHRGHFDCFSLAFFSFGLLIKCFEKKQSFYFALLGGCLMWAQFYQPDVWIIIIFVLFAYFLWLSATALMAKKETLASLAKTVYPRFLLTFVVAILVGAPGVKKIFNEHLINRVSQIRQASSTMKDPSGEATNNGDNSTDQARYTQWVFATNWSLPPEDSLEFIVPGIFGDASMSPPYPYWGRLGQPHRDIFKKGQMTPNYRQHSVYLGMIAFLFAVYGVLFWLSGRTGRLHMGQPSTDMSKVQKCYIDIPFWCGVWIICLVLALGRYTFAYQIFYSIPYMDYLRAPIKFFNLTNVATGILAGFGMQWILHTQDKNSFKRLLHVTVFFLIFLGVLLLLFLVGRFQIETQVSSLGLGQFKETLAAYAIKNIIRSFALTSIVAGVIWRISKTEPQTRWMYCYILCGLLVFDLSSAAKRYVKAQNIALFVQKNPLTQAAMTSTPTFTPNVMNLATRNLWASDWLSTSLFTYGVRNMVPATAEENELITWFNKLLPEPQHTLMVTRTAFVLGPRTLIIPWLQNGFAKFRGGYHLTSNGLKSSEGGDSADLILAETPYGKEPVFFYSEWEGNVPKNSQFRIANNRVIKTSAPVKTSPTTNVQKPLYEKLIVKRWRLQPGSLSSQITVRVNSECLAVFNERFSDNFEIRVNGQLVPYYCADNLWLSIILPEGDHVVQIRKKRKAALALISSISSILLCLWIVKHGWSTFYGRF